MKFYYSSKSPDPRGNIVVHADDCTILPAVIERIYLGIFANSNLAMDSAKHKLQLSRVRICTCCR